MFEELNKEEIFAAIIQALEEELRIAVSAARTAATDATNEESKPENKYDTRALEASYLARGQAQRVADLKEALFGFRRLDLKKFTDNDSISSTALVELLSEGKKQILFFAAAGGGTQVQYRGTKIQVITPATPLGQAVLRSKVGENIFVKVGKSEREFEILRVK
jgi:hypothetical protein